MDIIRGQSLLNEQINRAKPNPKASKENKMEKQQDDKIPIITTYNKTSPNLNNILHKHWHILQINEKFKSTCNVKPMTCYRRNKNLRDLIDGNFISNNKVIRKKSRTVLKPGHCSPCNSRRNNICCRQVLATKSFNKIFQQGKL